MHKNYLKVFYNTETKPYTRYPYRLCVYLRNRFSITASQTLLEVGCGRGEMLYEFKQAGIAVSGLDGHASGSKLLHGIPVHYLNLETDRLPYADNSFDVVFSKSVVSHLHNSENFITEIQRVLKSGGRLILLTPDWQSQRYVFYNDFTLVQPYIVSGVENLLSAGNLRDVYAELFYQLPLTWRFPFLKILLAPLRLVFPVKKIKGNSWWRWARELMILGTGIK